MVFHFENRSNGGDSLPDSMLGCKYPAHSVISSDCLNNTMFCDDSLADSLLRCIYLADSIFGAACEADSILPQFLSQIDSINQRSLDQDYRNLIRGGPEA